MGAQGEVAFLKKKKAQVLESWMKYGSPHWVIRWMNAKPQTVDGK